MFQNPPVNFPITNDGCMGEDAGSNFKKGSLIKKSMDRIVILPSTIEATNNPTRESSFRGRHNPSQEE